MTLTAQPKLPPLPMLKKQVVVPVAATPSAFSVTRGTKNMPQRVVLYGPGGIGKSTLASLAPNPIFIDLESGTNHLDVARVEGITSWHDMRECLATGLFDPFSTIVIDSATKAEELAIAHTLATVPHEKGNRITSLEGYGYGKGYQHAFETYILLLADLDRHIRAGRNVVLLAHDCTSEVPNPTGDDFLRYEPHLQQPKSGKSSIRERVFQWADHVLFLGYDVAVNQDGKGIGAGTRTIWPVERPWLRAKSRSLSQPVEFKDASDGTIWADIMKEAK